MLVASKPLARNWAAAKGVQLTTPEMGEALDLARPHAGKPWWQAVK